MYVVNVVLILLATLVSSSMKPGFPFPHPHPRKKHFLIFAFHHTFFGKWVRNIKFVFGETIFIYSPHTCEQIDRTYWHVQNHLPSDGKAFLWTGFAPML